MGQILQNNLALGGTGFSQTYTLSRVAVLCNARRPSAFRHVEGSPVSVLSQGIHTNGNSIALSISYGRIEYAVTRDAHNVKQRIRTPFLLPFKDRRSKPKIIWIT